MHDDSTISLSGIAGRSAEPRNGTFVTLCEGVSSNESAVGQFGVAWLSLKVIDCKGQHACFDMAVAGLQTQQWRYDLHDYSD